MHIVNITKTEWQAVHKDYKGLLNGKKTMITEKGLCYVNIEKVDWYAESSEPERISLINKHLKALNWAISDRTAIMHNCLFAQLETQRARYLELRFLDKLVWSIDMRGFNPRNIQTKYLRELQRVVSKYLVPIGANCEIEYLDNKQVSQAYFSFGQYNDSSNQDSYGINDERIFYYLFQGESDIDSFMKPGAEDFIIKKYEIEYRWIV